MKKVGYPEEDYLVLCTVTNIQFHSVFVSLDEFKDRSGMIHISEVAPGRIRNIRDFVKEGKKVVCKVLQVNKEKGHIDLSLRRVNEAQKRQKLNEIKQEQLAEKIVEQVAKQKMVEAQKVIDVLLKNKKYLTLFSVFEAVSVGEFSLDKLGLDSSVAESLTDMIKQRMKPAEVEISGTLKLMSYASNGIELVREVLLKAKKQGVEVYYLGGGASRVGVKSDDYKKAERILKSAVETSLDYAKSQKVVAEFVRKE